MEPMVIVNIALAGVAALLGVKWLLGKLDARNVRRAAARALGSKAELLGFEKIALLLFSYSDGDYREFVIRLREFIDMVKDPTKVLAEFSGAVKRMARTPEGLKMLQEAIAAATPAPAPVA